MADQEEQGSIHVGDIKDSFGIAIGHGAKVTINQFDGPPPLKPEEAARLLTDYRTRILEDTRYVNLRGIPLPRGRDGRPMPLQVLLDKVYIRIQATTEKQRRAQEAAEERSLLNRLQGESRSQSASRDILPTLHKLGEYFYQRGEVYEAGQRPEPVDPEEALKKHKRLVVLGAPGAGKSTLLRYLARRAAESSSNFVPVPVSLRDYATALAGDSTLALSKFALRTASAGDAKLCQALEDEIKKGHILWLVDALDEARGWVANAACQAAGLPGQLILTSRPVGYVSTGLESLPHFEVLPLMPENVDEFLHSWFSLLAAQRMADEAWTTTRVAWLKKQLEARPGIRALTRSPLLLTFLVILAGEERLQDLPEQRSELYRRYIEELLDSWETERRPKSGAEGQPVFTLGDLQGERARQVALQGFYYLGWALHLAYYGGKPQEPPTRATLTITLAGYLQAAGEKDARYLAIAILDFWHEAGLLETWHLGGNDYLAFRHLTFQEYASAWGLAEAWKRDPKRAWKFLRFRLHHYAWHEPLLLLVGVMDPIDLNDLAYRLLRGSSPYESSLHRDLFLSADLLAEGAVLSVKLQIIHKLDWLLRTHFKKRYITIFSGLPILFGILFSNLSGEFWFLNVIIMLIITYLIATTPGIFFYPARLWGFMPDRKNVFRYLGKIGSPIAVPGLIQALRNRNEDVRREVSKALGQIGSPAIPGLIQAIRDSDKDVFRETAKAFGQIGSLAIDIYEFFEFVWGDNNDVRWGAVEALRQVDDVQAIPALLQALHDSNWAVRDGATEALGRIGGSRAISALIQILQDGNNNMRGKAALALRYIGDDQVISTLILALQESSEDVSWHAAWSLGYIGDAKAIPALIQALQDNHKDVRRGAAEALGQNGDVQAIPALIQALQDSDNDVRRSAAEALGQIGDMQAIPALILALQDRAWEVSSQAARALGQIGDAQAIPALILALQDREQIVRENAAEALGQIGDTQSIPALIRALQDRAWYGSKAAIALGQIGDTQSIPVLILALQDREETVRNNAAEALGRIGDTQAIPALIQALQDREETVRSNATEALGRIGDAQAIPSLIQALQDNSRKNYGSSKAAEALGKCANKLNDIKTGKRAARMLWWHLTDILGAGEAFRSLEEIANRLSVLEVEAMPLVDPLLPEPSKKRW